MPNLHAGPNPTAPYRGVVGIGASAGGLKALQRLFPATPADSGLAFVVVQHLSPGHESRMAEILGRHTAMRVVEAAEGMVLEPDVVYTAPPGVHVALQEGRFRISAPSAEHDVRMPIDFFMNSLAQDQGAGAVCIILSGTGTDGTRGLRAVRGAGGMAMVQEPETAEFDAMPRSAVATGLADYVLPVEAMSPALLAHASGVRDDDMSAAGEAAIAGILDLVHRQTGNDYHRYKKGTVGRRILRRMGLHQIRTLPDYLKLLNERPDEVARLSKDMLIGVTSFFRDPEAFEALRETVIKPIVAAAEPGRPIRAWVPGCATGEEAYSIAILLKEELAARGFSNDAVQVFASDIDEGALSVGRAGLYASEMAEDVSPERLARFFVRKDRGYQVTKELRDSIVFSLHNLLADPPFAKLDLVSCRNLLIYIEPELQSKVLTLFAFTLNPESGYLFLGKSETVAKAGDWFDQVDEKWRVFRRNSLPVPAGEFPLGAGRLRGLAAAAVLPRRPHPVSYGDAVRRAMLEASATGAVLVDHNGKVLYLDGPTDRFLDLPAGEPALNVLRMVQERVATKLRAAVRKAVENGEASRLQRMRLKRRGSEVVASVTVRPAGDREHEKLVAILFEEAPAEAEPADRSERGAPGAEEAPLAEQLEAELRALRDELRATVEDHEASTEEFKATNEEVMAMNEELQSANEELESSREEIQSVNEELGTVNAQLNERLRELSAANNDLANLMAATDIATVFLDRNLRIRSFTPSATRLLSLIPADAGRPIGDIAQKFAGADIGSAAEQVLRDLSPVECEVRSKEGAWYMLRMLPYRTLDEKIDGVVATFTDVDRLKRSEEEALSSRAYAEGIVETIREPLVVLDAGLRVVSANQAFYRTFRTVEADTEGVVFFELGSRQWDIPNLRELLEKLLPEKATVERFVVEHEFPELGTRAMDINARTIMRGHGQPPLILLAIEDITERKRTQDESQRSREELEQKVIARTSELQLKSEQLFQSQKMEAIGRLAGGVAHDFNNMMTVVTGYADRLLRGRGLTDDQRGAIKQMRSAGDRASKLTRQLLAFSRKQILQPVMLDLNDVIAEVHRMLPPVIGEDIEVAAELAKDLWLVKADPVQITHVAMNLATNARDAMPKGGKLTIRTTNLQIDASAASRQPDIPAGSYVLLEVVDTGHGMDEVTRSHLFEPFFTTKESWAGTGLGLSSVHGIVEQSGGFIRVETAPNRGTTFRMYFPAFVPAPSDVDGGDSVDNQKDPTLRGSETILVVEDEPEVCALVSADLEDLGYRVLAARTAGEAMGVAQAHAEDIALLLVDVVLPGVSGHRLAQMLRSRGNVRRVLFMSGHTEKHIVDHGVVESGVAFIAKPFTAEELARKVREVLDSER